MPRSHASLYASAIIQAGRQCRGGEGGEREISVEREERVGGANLTHKNWQKKIGEKKHSLQRHPAEEDEEAGDDEQEEDYTAVLKTLLGTQVAEGPRH